MNNRDQIEARLDAAAQARAARPAINYDKMQREFPKQKAALTRALNSGDYSKVIKTCANTIAQWNETGAWPDDWSRWQRALDDAYNDARAKYVRGETEERPIPMSLSELPLIADLL